MTRSSLLLRSCLALALAACSGRRARPDRHQSTQPSAPAAGEIATAQGHVRVTALAAGAFHVRLAKSAEARGLRPADDVDGWDAAQFR